MHTKTVRGILGKHHQLQPAEMRFTMSLTHGRIVWQQRGISDSAKHLNRDYVNNETFDDIVTTWFRCDWHTIHSIEEQEGASVVCDA